MKIIGTDYENYIVIYSCLPIIKNIINIDLLWIMGSDPFLDKEYIREATGVISAALPNYPQWLMMRTIQFWCWKRS